MGGPLEGGMGAWWPIYLAGALLLLGLAVAAGALARALCGRGHGFIAGVVAYVAAAWWLRVRWGLEGQLALVGGFAASATIGVLLRLAERSNADRRPWLLAGCWALLLGSGVATLRSGDAHEHRADGPAAQLTVARSELVGTALSSSPASFADDLAAAVPEEVVTASGERWHGGARLVVRIHEGDGRGTAVTRCWRYRVDGNEPVDGPDEVDCPRVPRSRFHSTYTDRVLVALTALPPEGLRKPEAVRAAVERAADGAASGPVTVEAGRRDDGILVVAARTGINACMLTRIAPDSSVDRVHTIEPVPIGPEGCHPTTTWF